MLQLENVSKSKLNLKNTFQESRFEELELPLCT